MQLLSTAFQPNMSLPTQFTCRGNELSPPLSIRNVPERAVSLALIMHDPDAPHGDAPHWLVWNIDPTISEIIEGEAPSGSQEGLNYAGRTGYGSPCPPKGTGTHRYIFELYALDTTLHVPATIHMDELRQALQPHLLTQATLIGTDAA